MRIVAVLLAALNVGAHMITNEVMFLAWAVVFLIARELYGQAEG